MFGVDGVTSSLSPFSSNALQKLFLIVVWFTGVVISLALLITFFYSGSFVSIEHLCIEHLCIEHLWSSSIGFVMPMQRCEQV